jgi:flagellar protein FliS
MSLNANSVNAYRQTKVKTASGGKIIVMLYDEAMRQIDRALSAIDNGTKELDKIHNAIVKAQDIVTELMVSLDFDAGGDISRNLFNLYVYFNNQLMDANVKKDAQPLREIRPLIGELRDAWAEIAAKTAGPERSAGGGLNISG